MHEQQVPKCACCACSLCECQAGCLAHGSSSTYSTEYAVSSTRYSAGTKQIIQLLEECGGICGASTVLLCLGLDGHPHPPLKAQDSTDCGNIKAFHKTWATGLAGQPLRPWALGCLVDLLGNLLLW